MCCFNSKIIVVSFPADTDVFKVFYDVLKTLRRLKTKQDVFTTSGKRRQIYDVLKTSDLGRLEDA